MAKRVLQLPVIREGFIPAPKEMGWPTGIRCPRCCKREIVYNGNYFCSGFGDFYEGAPQECGWALPDTDDAEHFHTEPHHVLLQQALVQSQYERIEREERERREKQEKKR